MNKFTYDMMLSPYPIRLSIGTLRKPTLEEIFKDIGFEQYQSFEGFTRLTPEIFYTKMNDEEGLKIWDSFTDLQKQKLTLFNVVKSDPDLAHDYVELFNAFFEEQVIFEEGYFVWLDKSFDVDLLQEENAELPKNAVVGVVGKSEIFQEVLQAIQQVCCCYEDTDNKDVKFKNAVAEKLYKRMKQAEAEKKIREESDKKYSLPNIISAVSNNHPTISPLNVYQLTVFQLIDAFQRRQNNISFDMHSLSVSVWGDKEQKFDPNVWFANNYDK